MEGNLRFKIDWASLIVGSKFTVFALFYFVFEGNFPSTSPRRAYIWRGDLTEGFLRFEFGGLYLEGLIHGVACVQTFPLPQNSLPLLPIFSEGGGTSVHRLTWRGLFSEFYGISQCS